MHIVLPPDSRRRPPIKARLAGRFQNAPFASTNNNSFNVRANGGVRFVTSGAGMTLDGQTVLTGSSPLNGGNLISIGNFYSTFGGNFFVGQTAGNSTVSGAYNTAVGYGAFFSDTSGGWDTAFGWGALGLNTTGDHNTAIGTATLAANTVGVNNTAVGANALYQNHGSSNIALGSEAGVNYTGNESGNIDIGNNGQALENNIIRIGTPGIQTSTFIAGVINGNGGGLTNLNAAQLSGALPAISGASLTSLNAAQLTSISSGFFNFFVGSAGNATISGEYNTGMGLNALVSLTSGADNSAYGSGSLHFNTDGNDNAAFGLNTLHINTSGSQNTAVGSGALSANTSGLNNIALGFNAGVNISTTSSNIDIGHPGVSGDNNTIRIGTPGIQTNTVIAGVVNAPGGVQVGNNGTAMMVMQAGQAIMPGTSSAGTNFTVTFPQAFTSPPKVIASIQLDPADMVGNFTNQIFETSIQATTTTNFSINVTDFQWPNGWAQQLHINWIAWQ